MAGKKLAAPAGEDEAHFDEQPILFGKHGLIRKRPDSGAVRPFGSCRSESLETP